MRLGLSFALSVSVSAVAGGAFAGSGVVGLGYTRYPKWVPNAIGHAELWIQPDP